MKEIKFRFWNGMEMLEVSDIDFYNQSIGQMFKGSYRNEYPMDDCEIMQYTGLKDKNGKEIYEGDILKGEETWQCLYVQTLARFMLRDKDKEEYNMSALAIHDFEVIGNIYANPELLEVTP